MDFALKILFDDTVFAQEVDDEIVLLDMNNESYFGLDNVASDIWKLLHEGKTIQEAYNALLEIYDVGPDVLKMDLESFINTLIDNKLAMLV